MLSQWNSGGRVIGGVQAASAVTPVTSPRHVYILHELFFCTCSCLSSFMHCFRIARSAIAVHSDYRVGVARRRDIIWRTLPLTEPEAEPAPSCILLDHLQFVDVDFGMWAPHCRGIF